MSYKIYLDDTRMPTDTYPKTKDSDWLIIRNLTDFKSAIETKGVPDYISFDNDLGESLEEGKDAVKWMVYEKELDILNLEFKAHSANIGGPREDMVGLLNNWKKELKRRKMEQKEFTGVQKDKLVNILNALEFKDDIHAAGGEIYAVGGIVRDAVMRKESDDLDIVIRGIPYNELFLILSKFGKATDTSFVDENGKKDFGATKFVSHSEIFNDFLLQNGIRRDIDVMLPRKDKKELNGKGHRSIESDVNHMYTIKDDLDRRDITVNAAALDIHGNIIDNGHALQDILNGIIRMVSEDSFFEDPLRMVRAIRFAGTFDFDWDLKTLELMRKHAYLLSDKKELPRERFLMEFQKMIGKADLGRAVKLLVELGFYEAIFGVESNIVDFSKFEMAKSVAEFSFMLFEHHGEKVITLTVENITNEKSDIKYLETLLKYLSLKYTVMTDIQRINFLAGIFNASDRMLLQSTVILESDRKIARKFEGGELPKNANDLTFKGKEFKQFVADIIGISFDERADGAKMGKAKNLALQAIYEEVIPNQKESIETFLANNIHSWL